MTKYPKSLLTFAVSGAIFLSGCSSSDDSSGLVDDSQNTDVPDSPTSGSPVGETPPEASSDFALDAQGYDLIQRLGGYQLDELSEEVALIGEMAVSNAIAQSALATGGYNVDDRGEVVSVTYDTNNYDCALGGQLIVQRSELKINDSDYSRSLESTDFRFDQCQISMNGEHLLSGELSLFEDSISASRASTYDQSVTWKSFNWLQPDNTEVAIVADSQVKEFTSSDSRFSRLIAIEQFETRRDDQLVELISGGAFNFVNESSAAGGIQEYRLDADGRIQHESGVVVIIDTDPVLNRKLVSGGIVAEAAPFSGRVKLSADNNAELIYTAVDETDTTALQVDVDYRDSAGNTTTLNAQNFLDLPITAR